MHLILSIAFHIVTKSTTTRIQKLLLFSWIIKEGSPLQGYIRLKISTQIDKLMAIVTPRRSEARIVQRGNEKQD